MTKFVVFDTEGSGLFNFALPADDPTQLRLAQFSAVVTDDDLNVDREINLYVRPDGWNMQDDATEINGLTDEFLEEHGIPVLDVLKVYTDLVDEGYCFAAYNAQHDCKAMRSELRRAGLDDRFEDTLNTCLMRSCNPLKIPKSNGKRGSPRLRDACDHFGIVNEKEHDGLNDARAAYQILLKLRELDALLEPKVHYAKNHAA